jgi:hypothetical protein
MPSWTMAGTWKVIDFPPPVGIRPRVSFPSATDRIICSCKGLNEVKPQYFVNICLYGSIFIAGRYKRSKAASSNYIYKSTNCNSIFYEAKNKKRLF